MRKERLEDEQRISQSKSGRVVDKMVEQGIKEERHNQRQHKESIG